MSTHTSNRTASRLWGLGIAFLLVCAFYAVRLAILELHPDNIGGHKQDGTTERTVVVQAVRGQIYDRNGVPLVVNAYTYDLTLDYAVLPKDQIARNDAILKALLMLEGCGEVGKFATYDFPFEGYYPSYTYKTTVSDPVSDTYDTFLDVVDANGLRREAILRAEGEKHSEILVAEGHKEAAILKAAGEAEAIREVQQALADSLKMLNEAAPADSVLKLKAIEAMQKVADGQATKIIIPSEMQGLVGLANGIVEGAGK